MKNPFKQLSQCIQTWNSFRKYSGFFTIKDALMQIHRVLLPARLNDKLANKGLNQYLAISDSTIHCESVVKIHCKPLKLDFFWNGKLDNNLFFMAEQEFSEANPHCYTTFPIVLDCTRHIIDVGACEGLFAYRLARKNSNIKVHCFEPSKCMADLILDGASMNEVSQSVVVHSEALLDTPGFVKFETSDSPDAGTVVPCSPEDPEAIKSNTLDDFCKENRLELSPHDLIKIDAEGSDFDVLKGARQVIKDCRPQIAVTTYHKDDHAEAIFRWLNDLDLGYRFRLKGFSFWTTKPRPVLLLASTISQ